MQGSYGHGNHEKSWNLECNVFSRPETVIAQKVLEKSWNVYIILIVLIIVIVIKNK